MDPGNYVIYSRVLSPSGEKLAITFNGLNTNVTVQPLSYMGRQKWAIADYGDGSTQSISPTTNLNLQAAWGNEGVTVLSAGGYVWIITSTDAGYTIQDGGETANWEVADATIGAIVPVADDTGEEKQRWILERV